MTLTLSIVIYKNFSKAISLYKIETIGKKNELKKKEDLELSDSEFTSKHSLNNESYILDQIYEDNFLPFRNIIMIVINYAGILIFALLKGGSGIDSIIGIQQCSNEY